MYYLARLQVVVVAGGTNDWQNAPNPDYTVAQWADEAAAFLQQVIFTALMTPPGSADASLAT